MAKRNYNKKSNYWSQFNQEKENPQVPQIFESQASFSPDLCGEPFYTSDASYTSTSTASRDYTGDLQTKTRINRAALAETIDRFSSIRKGMLPYKYAADGIHVRDAIELCQKAYANVPIFRNAIDIMSEFANTDLYLEGGTKKSRDFFNSWLKKVNIWHLKDQYFREYYRSGNIFLYRVDGEFNIDDFIKLTKSAAPKKGQITNAIPIRYICLNPYDVVAKRTSTFAVGAFEKILSEYEMARLQNPVNEEDKQIMEGLPQDVQDKIKIGTYYKDGLKIRIDPMKLSYSFYKKQDYEPFAIPFGYAVLEDINAKLELKKMDQAITRTVENVVLLITMGTDPDKGGINPNNLNAMQMLFKNESVGRVLISDYTTKADFVIPDLNKVLGPEKYQILNEDIKQGLQNIIVGEEKYGATEIKAKIFADRLKESRQAFLNDFLQKEIKRISSDLGFKSYPVAKFKDLDMRDEVQLMKVSTRLMELGVLTPQQGMDMFHSGNFPLADELSSAQEEFVTERKKGHFNPIVGGVPMVSPPTPPISAANKKPAGINLNPNPNQLQNKTQKVAGRPQGTTGIPISKASFSRKDIEKVVKDIERVRLIGKEELKAALNIKRFSKSQESMLDKLCEAVICSSDSEKWEEELISCVKDFDRIASLGIKTEILDISSEHQLDPYPSAILYHSQSSYEN